jgi:hypothetical protein
LNLIAKLARSTILSSSLFKPIHHPNSIFAWSTKQKSLHWGGAHGLQTKEGIEEFGWPKSRMVYADLDE